MPRIARLIGALLPVLLLGQGCTTVPYTHRSQLMLMSESDDLQLGAAAYKEVLNKEKIAHDARYTEPVQRVGRNIAAVAAKSEYQWEFTVIDDPKTANAFCLPGGKVAVYTGIFPYARDEAGLAAVIGHEVAHALARHGAERMSRDTLAQVGAVGVAVAAGASGAGSGTQQAILQAYGLGSTIGIALPFSRSQESEADHIGLILMAKAGYDPHAAIALWKRMAAAEHGSAPPEWLSTHPAPSTREQDLGNWMAETMSYFKAPGQPVAMLPQVPGAPGAGDQTVGANEPKYRRVRVAVGR